MNQGTGFSKVWIRDTLARLLEETRDVDALQCNALLGYLAGLAVMAVEHEAKMPSLEPIMHDWKAVWFGSSVQQDAPACSQDTCQLRLTYEQAVLQTPVGFIATHLQRLRLTLHDRVPPDGAVLLWESYSTISSYSHRMVPPRYPSDFNIEAFLKDREPKVEVPVWVRSTIERQFRNIYLEHLCKN